MTQILITSHDRKGREIYHLGVDVAKRQKEIRKTFTSSQHSQHELPGKDFLSSAEEYTTKCKPIARES